MLRQTTIRRRAVSQGGALAADLRPGDKVGIAGGGRVGIVNARPFRSEGAAMIRLELHGGLYAVMPETCDVDAAPLDTAAFSARLGATVGMVA